MNTDRVVTHINNISDLHFKVRANMSQRVTVLYFHSYLSVLASLI